MQKTWTWSTTGYGLISKSNDDIIALCHAAGLAGIKISTFHLPFSEQDNLASIYETVRRKAIETARTWMERSALVGATVGIQHSTTSRYNVDVEGLKWRNQSFIWNT